MARRAEPWFSERQGTVLFYRVNRRERSHQLRLMAREYPSAFAHLLDILDFRATVRTGRQHQREWHLGNKSVDRNREILTGVVGYVRSGQELIGVYRTDDQVWEDVLEERGSGVYAPFGFDGQTRILAVLKHPQFSGKTLAEVFTDFLTQGEDRLTSPTTDWAVEPMLDDEDFYEWIRRTPYVERVRFVAKLPNPDGLDGLEFVNRRMDELEAGQIAEELVARDREVGLRNLDQDAIARGYVDSAVQGFGYVTARGHDAENGRVATISATDSPRPRSQGCQDHGQNC